MMRFAAQIGIRNIFVRKLVGYVTGLKLGFGDGNNRTSHLEPSCPNYESSGMPINSGEGILLAQECTKFAASKSD